MRSLRRHFTLRTLFVLVAMVAIGLALWRPLLISYHEWQLNRVKTKTDERSVAVSLFHLKALLQLGHYEKTRIVLVEELDSRQRLKALFGDLVAIPVDDRILALGSDEIIIYAPKKQLHRFNAVVAQHEARIESNLSHSVD